MDAKTVLFLIALVGFSLVLWLWLGSFMVRRAAKQVIRIFRAHQALDIVSAKTAQELGLIPRPFLIRLIHTRDWKPTALKKLLKAGIIQATPDNRLYLSNSVLQKTIFAKKV